MYLISFTNATYSHTTSTDKSVLQRKSFAIVKCFSMKNSMVSYEQVCVRNRTLKEIAANCDLHIQRMRSWKKYTYLVNGAYLQPFIFETVQLLI